MSVNNNDTIRVQWDITCFYSLSMNDKIWPYTVNTKIYKFKTAQFVAVMINIFVYFIIV